MKRVRETVHLRRNKPTGWAFDMADVRAAKAHDVVWVRLEEQERGVTYLARLDIIIARGEPFDYGCGRQLCLAEGYWGIESRTASRIYAPKAPVQLTLFGGQS